MGEVVLKSFSRIVPENESNKRSWSCEKSLLTTEQKIFAISNGYTLDVEAARRKRAKREWKEIIRKWMGKCPWGLPWTLIILSAIQVKVCKVLIIKFLDFVYTKIF